VIAIAWGASLGNGNLMEGREGVEPAFRLVGTTDRASETTRIAAGRESVRNRRPHILATARDGCGRQGRIANVRWRRQRAPARGRRIGEPASLLLLGRLVINGTETLRSVPKPRERLRSPPKVACRLEKCSRTRWTRRRGSARRGSGGGEGTHDGLSGGSRMPCSWPFWLMLTIAIKLMRSSSEHVAANPRAWTEGLIRLRR
jgi:hypothetical protein